MFEKINFKSFCATPDEYLYVILFSTLPSFSKDEVEGDIASVKSWIDQKKDEL